MPAWWGTRPALAVKPPKKPSKASSRPFLVDRVLADPDALRVLFAKGPGADPELFKTYCSVEIALYDLTGKALGVPVSELLGGRVRDRIRLYGSAGMYMAPEAHAAEAAAIAALGFKAYKMRPAQGPEQDLEAVRLMRQAVGPDFDLMVDAHTWWRMGDRSYSLETVENLALARWPITISRGSKSRCRPTITPPTCELKEKDLVPLASGRARAERRALPRPDPHAGRGLRPDGRLLPGRLHPGPPDLSPRSPGRACASRSIAGARRSR